MIAKKRAKRYCSAYGCQNNEVNTHDLTFFTLPKDIERRKEWLMLLDRDDLLTKEDLKPESYLVCSTHFDDSSFQTLRKLRTGSIPIKVASKPQITTFHVQGGSFHIGEGSFHPQDDSFHPQDDSLHPQDNSFHPQDDSFHPRIGSIYSIAQWAQSQKYASTQTEPVNRSDKNTQVAKALIDQYPTPQELKLKEKLRNSQLERRRLERELKKVQRELERRDASVAIDHADDEVGKRFHKLIEWQNKLKGRSNGNRYDSEFKIFALNLYYASPRAYRSLRTILKLPSRATIHRFKIDIPQKLDDRVIKNLEFKMKSFPNSAKYCSICVHEVALKNSQCGLKGDEFSSEINAYTIMLQGIHVKWQQPIAYVMLATTKHFGELDSWLEEVITKLSSIRIKVKAVITDQGSSFDKFAKEIKNVSAEKPYFMYHDKKICYIFDIPQLIKSIRDNLITSDFYYDEKRISWDFIKELHDDQKDKNFRLIPKFTSAHLNPNNFKRTRVKYAVQVFSRTVSAALHTYVDLGIISHDARPTATFLEVLNDLFDVLNSSKTKSLNKYKCAFRNAPYQEKALDDALTILTHIKAVDKATGKVNADLMKTLRNTEISINSIRMLYEDLKIDGIKYIFTRQLNQECLEDFFGSLMQQSGMSEPTPIQFQRAFSKLFICNMLKSSPTANCEMDIYDILLQAEDVMKTFKF